MLRGEFSAKRTLDSSRVLWSGITGPHRYRYEESRECGCLVSMGYGTVLEYSAGTDKSFQIPRTTEP